MHWRLCSFVGQALNEFKHVLHNCLAGIKTREIMEVQSEFEIKLRLKNYP